MQSVFTQITHIHLNSVPYLHEMDQNIFSGDSIKFAKIHLQQCFFFISIPLRSPLRYFFLIIHTQFEYHRYTVYLITYCMCNCYIHEKVRTIACSLGSNSAPLRTHGLQEIYLSSVCTSTCFTLTPNFLLFFLEHAPFAFFSPMALYTCYAFLLE